MGRPLHTQTATSVYNNPNSIALDSTHQPADDVIIGTPMPTLRTKSSAPFQSSSGGRPVPTSMEQIKIIGSKCYYLSGIQGAKLLGPAHLCQKPTLPVTIKGLST